MTEINLLPWREKKKEQEKKKFIIYLALGIIIAVIFILILNFHMLRQINFETNLNHQLQAEIDVISKKIKEVNEHKAIRQLLISRMEIIYNLLTSRTNTVHLFDELIKILPDGIYLQEIERVGDKVIILGFADSNSNISLLMRNIDKSAWLSSPKLIEIKKIDDKKSSARNLSNHEGNNFKLSFMLSNISVLSV